MKRLLFGTTRRSAVTAGAIFVVVCLVAGMALFQKNRILTTLSPGETVRAEFPENYRIQPYVTKVKIAGVPVGVVTGVRRGPGGIAEVTMKVQEGTRAKLRSAPSAAIRPTTLLGGNYYVQLTPGGDPARFSGVIPVSRDTVPVELDKVLETLQPPALAGIQGSIRQLDGTLTPDTRRDAQRLLADAPGTLGPSAHVLQAVEGENPATDLTDLVHGLESTARVLSAQQGQLADIVRTLDTNATTLDRERVPLAATVGKLPPALASTRAGLADLQNTLAKLRQTAAVSGPTAESLNRLLIQVDPAVREALPVVRNLQPLLADAHPLVEQLTPTAQLATGILDDIRGPVLQRVNGPILTTIHARYDGQPKPLYQELAYMLANLDNGFKYVDRNGSALKFQLSAGPGSLGSLPLGIEQLLQNLPTPQQGGGGR